MIRTILVLLLLAVVGCALQPEVVTDDRFIVTNRQVNTPTGYSAVYTLCDTRTDTEYLVLFGIKSVAVTPLGTTCN